MADQDYARWAMGLLPTSDPTHKPHQTTISENPSSSLWEEDVKISAGWSYLGHSPKFLQYGSEWGKLWKIKNVQLSWAAKLMAHWGLEQESTTWYVPVRKSNVWTSLQAFRNLEKLAEPFPRSRSQAPLLIINAQSMTILWWAGVSYSMVLNKVGLKIFQATPPCPNMHVISYTSY